MLLTTVLACPAALRAEPSIFDDDWKPPAESPAAEEPPTTAPVAPAPAATAHPTPRLVPWTAPSAAQAEAPSRAAVPGAAAIAAAEKKVKAAYRSEYNAKTPAKKATLPGLLLGEAQHRGIDTTVLYVVLQEARNLAAAEGQPETAVQAARGTRDAFEITPEAARELEQPALCSAIGSMLAAEPAAAHRAADLALQLAEFDIGQGEYAAAVPVARQALSAARKADDAEYAERVSGRVARIEAIGSEYEQDKDALAGLKQNPADATANLAAGRFFTFYLDQPLVGLPHLAKGLDPVLRSLAARDLAAGGAAPAGASASSGATAGQIETGDAWADVSKKRLASDPPVKDAMQRRAIFWYDRANARQKARELRIRRAVPGLTGEYYRGQDFDYRLLARTDAQIEFDWAGSPPEFLMGGENFSVRWSGFVKARPGRYSLTAVHNDGVRVWLDGQLVIDKWGANVGRDAAPVTLTGSEQELKVEYTQHAGGSYMGLGWVVPGAKHAVAIPAEALSHDPLPPEPVYASLPQPGRDGKIDLIAAAAVCQGGVRFVQGGKSAADLDHWTGAGESASWDFEAPEGEYDVGIVYSCAEKRVGNTYSLSVGNNFLTGPVQSTGGWDDYHAASAGRVRLAAGLQSLRIQPNRMARAPFWHLSEITLTPVKTGG